VPDGYSLEVSKYSGNQVIIGVSYPDATVGCTITKSDLIAALQSEGVLPEWEESLRKLSRIEEALKSRVGKCLEAEIRNIMSPFEFPKGLGAVIEGKDSVISSREFVLNRNGWVDGNGCHWTEKEILTHITDLKKHSDGVLI